MKFFILLILTTLSFNLFAKEWTPKYRVQQLDTKSTIKNKKKPSIISRDKISTKTSALKRDEVKKVKAPIATPQARPSLIQPMQSMQATNDTELLALFKIKYKTKKQFQELKNKTLALTQKAVPALIKVIKSSDYPDKNRWIAMFMLGRVMGKKSANFISKFSAHPNWMLRLASLKVLLALDQKQFKGLYVKLLKDKSMIVRHQALENIKAMKLKDLAPYVWAMLYDKSNYAGQEGERKRAHIIKQAIKTVGDLGFQKSKDPMLKMIKSKKYRDIAGELDYSLNKLSENKSPDGNLKMKIHYWSRVATANKIIR